ncbi:flavodoxin family protein [Clostridium minihomine]|uniref:flavodoxin family protein n=1 Tax=Clostridium minihomine TaxID=2045012 RepID=UPI000C766371|nr:flavodoxin family protein [Clostridium minihomine]
MKLYIHDLSEKDFNDVIQRQKDDIVISETNKLHSCLGCYDCWLKTPTKCAIKDDYSNLGKVFANCDDIIMISNCYYGGFSPFVKGIMDRSLSYFLPYLEIRKGESRHKLRYKKKINTIQVHFYGEDITQEEKKTAKQLVLANSRQFNIRNESCVKFYSSIIEMKGLVL